jgi:hypothetical protein
MNEYKWEDCQECIRISDELGIGKRLCSACADSIICSQCGEKEDSVELTISNYDGRPLCIPCSEHECCMCGLVSEEEDAADDEFVWFYQFLYCEECARTKICNQCGGACDYSCPSCERVHDCECECEIECTECGELFTYIGSDMRDRSNTKGYSEAAKEICDECWEDMQENSPP